jgi:hypothetical protein
MQLTDAVERGFIVVAAIPDNLPFEESFVFSGLKK